MKVVESKPLTHSTALNLSAAEEFRLLLVLGAIQFTSIVDFVILMPLGPRLMDVFRISPEQFGHVVSAYAVSAGISGVFAGFFLDRFDRKRALLFLFAGFGVGTFLCGVAPRYELLAAARAVAGAFGGVTGAVIMAIISDAIPESRRGRAMGIVMSAFSLASVLGIPAGLYLANHFEWHAPFFVLAFLSAIILVAAARVLPGFSHHVAGARDVDPVRFVREMLSHVNHLVAFLFMSVLTLASFLIGPFLATHMVRNVGFQNSDVVWIYAFGGAATIFTMNWVGKWADRSGKLRVFLIVGLSSSIPTVAVTCFGGITIPVALFWTTIYMICMSGRMVPAMALLTATVLPRYRGAFMSLNAAVQHLSAGIAADLAGRVLKDDPKTGHLLHVEWLGMMAVGVTVLGALLSLRLKSASHVKSSAGVALAATEGVEIL